MKFRVLWEYEMVMGPHLSGFLKVVTFLLLVYSLTKSVY